MQSGRPTTPLRQAIWRKEDSRWIVCGIPDILYTDNGSDFTSQHFFAGWKASLWLSGVEFGGRSCSPHRRRPP
jgi:hypothetical protein